MLMAYEGWLQMLASAVLILFGGWMLLNAFKTSSSIATARDASCKGVFVSTYALTIANPLTIVAFTGFAAQSAISGFSTIVINSAALFAGSLLIQLTLALFGSALKAYLSKPSVILYLNVLSGFSFSGLGLMKMF